VEVSGSEGSVVMEHDRIVRADLRTPDPTLVTPGEGNRNASASSPIVTDVSGHRKLIEDFLRTIETGQQPICNGHEGRRSVELIEAIYESSRRAMPIKPGA